MQKNIVILVAEDNEGHFVLTKLCLRRAGISNEIVWLEDGQKTLDFLHNMQKKPLESKTSKKYILLLDIRMPKVDGIKVLEQIKASDDLKGIPVIIVSTSDAPTNLEICSKLGCDAYITKPIDETLPKTIEKACHCMN